MKINELNTIIKNGGGNYCTENNKLVTYNKGYMVSTCDIVKINIHEVSMVNTCKIISHLLKQYEGINFGFWVNEGFLYIDISINILNINSAQNLAIKNNQIAIWDCVNNEEIKITEYHLINEMKG